MAGSAAATTAPGALVDRDVTYDKTRLFLVSALALATAGIAASVRANSPADIQRIFLDPIDSAHSAEMIGAILGIPFLGFALTIAIGSPLLDVIGMGLLLPIAGILLAAGTLIMVFAGSFATGPGVYTVLWAGALVVGIGWGLVETVINPVMRSLCPRDKAARLNAVHAWWPGGLVIGGLLGVAMTAAGLGWQAKLALLAIPGILVAILCMGARFPPTEALGPACPMG